jgi:hypothetical protein
MMAEENNYSESPYVASRAALLARQQKQDQVTATSQSIHNSFQQQQYKPNNSQFSNNQHQQHHQQQQQQQQQQQYNTNNNNNQHLHLQQTLIDSTALTSHTVNGSNQIDKENRHFSSLNQNNDNKFLQSNNNNFPSSNTAKSNAIFDRFDIMNSEKPHRFKV